MTKSEKNPRPRCAQCGRRIPLGERVYVKVQGDTDTWVHTGRCWTEYQRHVNTSAFKPNFFGCPPLFKGGQGRSAQDVENIATMSLWIVIIALAAVLAFVGIYLYGKVF